MAPSRSPLNRQSIVAAMTELLGPGAVETGGEQLRAASVDRFRKYTSVHGIYDGPIPAAIVYPSSTEDVAAILRFAAENLVNLVPRTGQTATEAGLETVIEDSLVVDGPRMNAILSIDPVDMLATTQCGVRLQELEDTLRAQGLTTGHSPQSKPLAQMGGLVATRSIGQFSTLYGGIEDMVGRLDERVDSGLIRRWFENLNWGQDKIDAEKADMLSRAHLGFTTEVSVSWSRTSELFDAVMSRIRSEFPRAGDLTMLGAHSSHSYQTGTNLYFVYDYTIRCSPREELELYHKPLNAIIVEEALRAGGSMVHHHGIGKYRTPWVRQEHGSAYYLLSILKHAFDPEGVMNAGTIFPLEPEAGAHDL